MTIGAQLWIFDSVRTGSELASSLLSLNRAGYTCIEVMYGHPAQTVATLTASGLPVHAVHVALCAIPEVDSLLDFVAALKANVVCVSGLLQWEQRSVEDYLRAADALNALGHGLRERGVELQYHNHDFEFIPTHGKATGMDLLLGNLDFRNIGLCFDAGWTAKAGEDPVEFISLHGKKIGTVHLRDFAGSISVPLGKGDLDLAGVIKSLRTVPELRAVVVEQDPGTDNALDDMLESRSYLARGFGL